jgi:acetate kinase
MGFTAIDGLPMGTRCGALDPGVLRYLMDGRGMDARAIWEQICRGAAWLGVEVAGAADARGGPRTSPAGSRVSAWVSRPTRN